MGCRFRRAAMAAPEDSDSAAKPKRRVVPGAVLPNEYLGGTSTISSPADSVLDLPVCAAPEYSVYTWVVCLVAIATCLKLYFMVKMALASAFVLAHSILILCLFPVVSSARADSNNRT